MPLLMPGAILKIQVGGGGMLLQDIQVSLKMPRMSYSSEPVQNMNVSLPLGFRPTSTTAKSPTDFHCLPAKKPGFQDLEYSLRTHVNT
jgi:hypothetical protein